MQSISYMVRAACPSTTIPIHADGWPSGRGEFSERLIIVVNETTPEFNRDLHNLSTDKLTKCYYPTKSHLAKAQSEFSHK